jgi:predicted small metal-binding protein
MPAGPVRSAGTFSPLCTFKLRVSLRDPVMFRIKEDKMRLFECGTLVPGCDWHTRANDDAEVVRRAVEHMKTAHGETTIRENMVDNIKARIRNEANAA